MAYGINPKVELRKSDIDLLIYRCNRYNIGWNEVFKNYFGSVDIKAEVLGVDRVWYDVVNYTLDELSSEVQTVFYDGVTEWQSKHDFQDKKLNEIGRLSSKLKTTEKLSIEERDLVFDFLDPHWRNGFTGMPHIWLWIILGGPRPNDFYFDSEQKVYRVPSVHSRNILMFEIGAFFHTDTYLNKEKSIEKRLAEIYPNDQLHKDFDFWIQYIHDPDNSISRKILRKFPLHQWLWQTYRSLLVNRLEYPQLSFESFNSVRDQVPS